ncbi:MAG: hypothetical protein Q9174_004757 [Haloplaca sp. 1 TL-2023]
MLHGHKSKSKGSQNAKSSNTDLGHNSHSPHPKMTSAHQAPRGGQTMQQSAPSRGQKRKAQETLQSPARRRRRQNDRQPVAHHRGTMATERLPTRNEHKDLPAKIFAQPKGVLHSMVQNVYKFTSEFSNPSSRSGQAFQCKVTGSLVDGEDTRTTQGHGRNMRAAENAAYLRMAISLKDTEAMKAKLGLITVDTISESVRKEEKDSKMDIYNYAARFDAVPDIRYRSMKGAHPRGKKRGTIYEVTVVLQKQNIEATGRGLDKASAEISAGMRFKEAAQRYQAEHGANSLFIRDSAALTTDNSRDFFEYYKIRNPNAQIELIRPLEEGENEAQLTKRGTHRAQVQLNGKAIGRVVSMSTKKKTEDLAYLTAALEINTDPQFFKGFIRALTAGNGKILKPINPVTLSIDEDCQLAMRETLLAARKAGLPDEIEEMLPDEEESESRSRVFRRQLSPQGVTSRTRFLESAFERYSTDPDLAVLRQKREELPMNQYRAKVLDLVSNNSYSIIVGATGSGKTTQVPQIVLDEAIVKGHGTDCNVICTQPRRIAATSVARRVADERSQRLGETAGYHVRFDPKVPSYGGSITYCTTGILLQQLQHQPDEVFDRISHLVIDEVHERDIQIDFLLIILKRVMAGRVAAGKSTPKVVLMSATMDTELFASYFESKQEGKASIECPSLSVPGRTFPVKERYLGQITEEIQRAHGPQALQALQSDIPTQSYLKSEDAYRRLNPLSLKESKAESQGNESVIDWKTERKVTALGEATVATDKDDAIVPHGLVSLTVAHISRTTDEGAILVFLPGLEEMVKVETLLKGCPLGVNFRDESLFKIYMLHSSQPSAQREVFDDVPKGCRKIILSTNIAETSITIPDVQHVVDTGKLRERQYDQTSRITQLKCTWISKSNSKQRAGRAGRVQNGNYYALFSSERYNKFRAVGLPEMLRSDLQEICLDIKTQAFKYPIRQFLAEALEPPSPASVDASILNLQALDALTEEEQITPLGRLLASLPVHPSLGKMIILGVIFRCLDPMLVLGAAAAERNIFLQPLDNRQAAHQAKVGFVRGTGSDHLALLNALREMREIRQSRGDFAMRQFAERNFIHISAFRTIDNTAKMIEEILVDAGLIPYTPPYVRTSGECGDPSLNENSNKVSLIKALAIAGHHPNLAISTGPVTHRTPGEALTLIHPSSVNYTGQTRGRSQKPDAPSKPKDTLYTYSSMARSNDGNTLYIRDTTECTPLMVSLFGGKLAMRPTSPNVLEMDGWLPFFVRVEGSRVGFARATKTVLEMRKALERLLAGAFKDLKDSKGKGRSLEGSGKSLLADEKVRKRFAEGVVEVLDRDVLFSEATATRGWGVRESGNGASNGDGGHGGYGRGAGAGGYSRGGGNGGYSRGGGNRVGNDSLGAKSGLEVGNGGGHAHGRGNGYGRAGGGNGGDYGRKAESRGGNGRGGAEQRQQGSTRPKPSTKFTSPWSKEYIEKLEKIGF